MAKVLADRIIEKLMCAGFSEFEQSLEKTFLMLDANGSGYVESDDIKMFLTSQGWPETTVGNETVQAAILSHLGLRDGMVLTFDAFKSASEKRTEQQYLYEIFRMNTTFHRIFSEIMGAPDVNIKTLSKESISATLQTSIDSIAERIYQNIQDLQLEIPTAQEVNLKYSMSAGDEGKMSYGGSEIYEGGLDAYIGLPSIKVVWAVYQEHCNSNDSLIPFKKQNEKETTPHAEFEFVTCVQDDIGFLQSKFLDVADVLQSLWRSKRREWPELAKPGQSRVRHSLRGLWLNNEEKVLKTNLRMIELICLILYTGPMYDKYNTSLRKFPIEKYEGLLQNRYTSTIHTITSGLMKLSKAERVPTTRRVYRGLGGKVLPEQFWTQDNRGCCSGVELGCMSTTEKVSIAIQYSDKKVNDVGVGRPTICEIEVGQIDCGAAMRWCSQFPHEEEILFGPLCNIERMGNPRVEVIQGILILVVPFRVSVNTKCLTLDQLEGRRKLLHLAAMDQLMWEAELEVKHLSLTSAHDMHTVIDEGRQLISKQQMTLRQEDCRWFNVDENYVGALSDALKAKRRMVNNCRLFLKSADMMAVPRVREREDAVMRQMAALQRSDPARAWLQRQSVQRMLNALLQNKALDFSDPLRFARAEVALDSLRKRLEDTTLPSHDADDGMVSREALQSFSTKCSAGIMSSRDISRTLEYLDGKYGPLPSPKDPDRYFRDVLCCYKHALGHKVLRRSAFRCLELLGEGLSGAMHGFPAQSPWEARLLAHFCVAPDVVGQFPLRRIEVEPNPVVELSRGITEEEAAFLAAFLSARRERKVVRVLVREVSLPDLPLCLLTAMGGFAHITGGDGGDRAVELQDLRVGPDALRLLIHAAAHASPPLCAAVLRLSRNYGLGEDPRPDDVCGLIIRLAERLACKTLHLQSCKLSDRHFDALATAVATPGRLPALAGLLLVANGCEPRSAAAGRLRAAWRASGREESRLVLELETAGFINSLLSGTTARH